MDHDSDEEELDDDGYMTVRVPGVVVKNLDSYVREVVDARGYSPDNIQVIFGLDNGQKFKKLGIIVILLTRSLAGTIGGMNCLIIFSKTL